jgi:hypothetical protein
MCHKSRWLQVLASVQKKEADAGLPNLRGPWSQVARVMESLALGTACSCRDCPKT